MPTVTIKHRWTGVVLYEHEVTDERMAAGLAMRDALECAAASRAYLSGAYLSGADLSRADLPGAYLSRAYLSGAYLSRAYLSGADLSRAHLSGADLSGAYLSGADLSRADLSGAYLSGAYLSGAYLSGAKWRDAIAINRAPLMLAGLTWDVYILDQHMQIGCELHAIAEWREFDDARITQMDGRDALRFWRAHKATLLALAESDGRGVVAVEPQAEAA